MVYFIKKNTLLPFSLLFWSLEFTEITIMVAATSLQLFLEAGLVGLKREGMWRDGLFLLTAYRVRLGLDSTDKHKYLKKHKMR